MLMSETSRKIYNIISPKVTDIKIIQLDIMSVTYTTKPLLSIIKTKLPKNQKSFDSWYRGLSYVFENLPTIDIHSTNEKYSEIISQVALLVICKYDIMIDKYNEIIQYLSESPTCADYTYFESIAIFDVIINYQKIDIITAINICKQAKIYNINYLRKVTCSKSIERSQNDKVVAELMQKSDQLIQQTPTRSYTEGDKLRIRDHVKDQIAMEELLDFFKITNS